MIESITAARSADGRSPSSSSARSRCASAGVVRVVQVGDEPVQGGGAVAVAPARAPPRRSAARPPSPRPTCVATASRRRSSTSSIPSGPLAPARRAATARAPARAGGERRRTRRSRSRRRRPPATPAAPPRARRPRAGGARARPGRAARPRSPARAQRGARAAPAAAAPRRRPRPPARGGTGSDPRRRRARRGPRARGPSPRRPPVARMSRSWSTPCPIVATSSSTRRAPASRSATPRQQDRPQRRRAPVRREQLLGEVRVPLGARVDARDRRLVGGRPEDALELAGGLLAVEGREVEPLGRARELGDQALQRRRDVRLVGPHRGHHEQRQLPEVADEEAQQVLGGVVGPVQILDHEHHRPVPRQAPQRGDHGLEPLRTRVAGLGGGRRRRHGEAAQGRRERGVRELAGLHRDAVAPQHRRLHGRGELAHEPRLADPGVARDEHDARRAARARASGPRASPSGRPSRGSRRGAPWVHSHRTASRRKRAAGAGLREGLEHPLAVATAEGEGLAAPLALDVEDGEVLVGARAVDHLDQQQLGGLGAALLGVDAAARRPRASRGPSRVSAAAASARSWLACSSCAPELRLGAPRSASSARRTRRPRGRRGRPGR